MKKLIKKHNQGGVSEIADAASYMIPIYGTYRQIKDTYNDPSWSNVGLSALSLAGDVGTILGVGALAKGAVGAARAGKLAKAAQTAYGAAHLKSANALSQATKAAKQYNRAKGAVNSLSLQGAPISTIIDYQRKANKAYNVAKSTGKVLQSAQKEFKIADNLLNTTAIQAKNARNNLSNLKSVVPGAIFAGQSGAGALRAKAKFTPGNKTIGNEETDF